MVFFVICLETKACTTMQINGNDLQLDIVTHMVRDHAWMNGCRKNMLVLGLKMPNSPKWINSWLFMTVKLKYVLYVSTFLSDILDSSQRASMMWCRTAEWDRMRLTSPVWAQTYAEVLTGWHHPLIAWPCSAAALTLTQSELGKGGREEWGFTESAQHDITFTQPGRRLASRFVLLEDKERAFHKMEKKKWLKLIQHQKCTAARHKPCHVKV